MRKSKLHSISVYKYIEKHQLPKSNKQKSSNHPSAMISAAKTQKPTRYRRTQRKVKMTIPCTRRKLHCLYSTFSFRHHPVPNHQQSTPSSFVGHLMQAHVHNLTHNIAPSGAKLAPKMTTEQTDRKHPYRLRGRQADKHYCW